MIPATSAGIFIFWKYCSILGRNNGTLKNQMNFYKDADIVTICLDQISRIIGKTVTLTGTKSVGGGCINNALKISTSFGDFFVKWNATAPPDLFQKEATGLHEMHQPGNIYLKIPRVIWTNDDELPGIIVMEYLNPAIPDYDFDEKLGRGIACLHRKSAEKFGFHHNNYCGTTVQNNSWTESWPDFFAFQRIEPLVRQIQQLRGLSAEDRKIYDRLIGRISLLLTHETIPSLIHGDLWSGNYMCTDQGPALIDPACYYADREMELGMMQLFGGFGVKVWNAYQDEFPLPSGWQERVRLYQLYHVLNHQLLFGGSYGWQALEIAREYL